MAPLFVNAWGGELSQALRGAGGWAGKKKKTELKGSDVLSQREGAYSPAGKHFPS